MGVVLIGDSAGAHFSIPGAWYINYAIIVNKNWRYLINQHIFILSMWETTIIKQFKDLFSELSKILYWLYYSASSL